MSDKPDWPAIKADYVETRMTLAEVEAKWGVPRGTLSARATRDHWHDEKQQFAAKLERLSREKNLEQRLAAREEFEDAVHKIALNQLGVIQRQMREGQLDPAKVLKLVTALEAVQRIGKGSFEK